MISQQSKPETISLLVTNQVDTTQEFQLSPGEGVFVGKSSNCRIQLNGDDLSDIHCLIEFENGTVLIQDWMSASGTHVNGERISSKVTIQANDKLQIGQYQIRIGTAQRNSDDGTSKQKTYSNPVDFKDDVNHDRHAAPAPESDFSEDLSKMHDDDRPSNGEGVAAQVLPEQHESGIDSDSMDIDADFFGFEEEETYDRETVALLHAEIEVLQAALAQRDAEQSNHDPALALAESATGEESDEVLNRIQELIDEANRSDERVAILEEMLFAAEATSRSELDERGQLEAWVGDIEKRIGQREDEHKAEIEALNQRLKESNLQQERLQKQLLHQAAVGGRAPQGYEKTLENLQARSNELQEKLVESENCRIALERRLEQQQEEQERALRDERVGLAQEKAKVSRMRYELSNKLSDIEEIPKNENSLDYETAHKIRTLREHLREIHEQEKEEAKNASIATRLSKLWKRVEY